MDNRQHKGYVFTGMCDSVHRGCVCLSACWDATHPQKQTPPLGSRHTPRSRHPPGSRTPPSSRNPSRSRHPLEADTPQEQTPPQEQTHPLEADTLQEQTHHPPGSKHPPAKHAGRYSQCMGGTHPTGMQSCWM